MQYFFCSLLSFVSLVLLSMCDVAIANGTANQNHVKNAKKAHQYPVEFLQSYDRECMQTSMGEGLGRPEAKRLCDCTINQFQQQYSLTEFQRLTIASRTNKASENTLVQVGQACFEQILYEE